MTLHLPSCWLENLRRVVQRSGRSEIAATTQRACPWQGTQGRVFAFVENDHFGTASLVGCERNCVGARTVRQCARRTLDSLRLGIHPAQARPNCEAALPFADHEARASTRPEAHLRLNCSTGNERSSKGCAVAWPREDANYRDVHTSRPGGETRNLGRPPGYNQKKMLASSGDVTTN